LDEAVSDILPETRAFLRDWLDWVNRGAPVANPYTRSWGLCSNAKKYDESGAVAENLGDVFKDEYPFGSVNYESRAASNTQHECPNRLAWARKHASPALLTARKTGEGK
jgi:hypothetical protein